MSDIQKGGNGNQVLLMVSGGRDSFLAACRLISEGYHIFTITYDNGYMSHTQNALEISQRLQLRFGTERVQTAGIHTIALDLKALMNKLLYNEIFEICKNYPNLLLNQANCLACHTTMYFHSIAYCKARSIPVLSEGARLYQKFFVELPEMRERYENLCKNHGIQLKLPVYDLESDIERKTELSEWGFLPKSYEPQCWMGCPMLKELTDPQRKSLADYYDNEIAPLANSMIQKLIPKKKIQSSAGILKQDYYV